MYINQTSVTGNATTNGCIGFKGSNASDSLTDLMIKAGEWNDVFVTFSQNAGNTAYTATGTLCKPVASGDNFSPPSLITESRSFSKALSFNTGNLTIGGYHDSSAGATPTRAFRGLIADFMVWDRALTAEEKIEVIKDYDKLIDRFTSQDCPVYIMPTYTAMMDLRAIISKRYGYKNFWE